MTEDLLQDLVLYKKSHEKAVSTAARSLITLFREVLDLSLSLFLSLFVCLHVCVCAHASACMINLSRLTISYTFSLKKLYLLLADLPFSAD